MVNPASPVPVGVFDVPLAAVWSTEGVDAVELRMRELAGAGVLRRAGGMVGEHLATGGKRLRARLALAATEALGAPRTAAVGWAAAVELLHNATLVHDDIQDGDRVRRGQPTVWARHGVAQAINAGDLMLMLPFLALDEAHLSPATRAELSRRLAWQAAEIVRGQAEEMALLEERNLDLESYRAAARGKTGGLFTLPVEGAALIAGCSAEEATALGAAFGDLGLLFQIVDDTLDLYGDKGRGEVGCDLQEGKVSALVAAHLQRAPADREWLVSLLETPREATPARDVAKAIVRFRASGALRAVLDEVRALIRATAHAPALLAQPDLRAVALGIADLATAPVRGLLAEADVLA